MPRAVSVTRFWGAAPPRPGVPANNSGRRITTFSSLVAGYAGSKSSLAELRVVGPEQLRSLRKMAKVIVCRRQPVSTKSGHPSEAAIGQKELNRCAQLGSSSDIGRSISLALAADGRDRFAMTLTPGCKTWWLRRRNRSPHESIDNQARWLGQLRSCGRGFDSRCPSFCNQAVGNFGRLGIMVNNAGVFTGLKTIWEGNETGIGPFDPSPLKTVRTLSFNYKKGTYLGTQQKLRPASVLTTCHLSLAQAVRLGYCSITTIWMRKYSSSRRPSISSGVP